MNLLKRAKFFIGFAFPRWVLFRRMCLKLSYDGQYHCCLSKGHQGHCHGDIGFEERYRKALEFYENARLSATASGDSREQQTQNEVKPK